MSTSQFCIQQRQQEKQKLNKIFVLGFASSALIHGILALTFPYWSFDSDIQTEKPMKLILVDQPKPEPKPEPKPVKAATPTVKPVPKPEPKPVKAATSTVKPMTPTTHTHHFTEHPTPPKQHFALVAV